MGMFFFGQNRPFLADFGQKSGQTFDTSNVHQNFQKSLSREKVFGQNQSIFNRSRQIGITLKNASF